MKIDPTTHAPVPAISGDDLLAATPDVSKYATIEVNNLSNLPSAYMNPERWVELTRVVHNALARPEIFGVVISHGTDTLEETAYWLDVTVKSDKPIVSKNKGVMVAMNGQISAAREVTKTHTSSVEAFKCGDFGFLGLVDPDRVLFSREPIRRQCIPVNQESMPNVEIVMMYSGANGRLLRDAVDHGAKGIVVQALGWGNLNVPMFDSVKYALAAGIPVVISTRVPNGRVLPKYGFEGGGKTLFDLGVVFADDLTTAKARILLMLLLQNGAISRRDLQAAFDH